MIWSRRQGGRLLFLLLFAWGLIGCTVASDSAVRKVALFEVVQERARLKRGVIADLDLQARQMIEHWDGIIPVDQQQIRREMRRGPRRFRRRCAKPECQVRVGRKVAAHSSMALWIKPNVLSDCEVFGARYDLKAKEGDFRARARGECDPAAVMRSLSKVVCFLITHAAGPRANNKGPGPQHAECMSLAALIQVERQFESFRKSKADKKKRRGRAPRRRADQEIKLAEQVLEFKRQYLAVSDKRLDRWSVSARCRVGQVYEEYGRMMASLYQKARAPRAVRRMGKDAVASYHDEVSKVVRQKVAPLQQMALKSYGDCLQVADENNLSSRYIVEARARVQVLQKTSRFSESGVTKEGK